MSRLKRAFRTSSLGRGLPLGNTAEGNRVQMCICRCVYCSLSALSGELMLGRSSSSFSWCGSLSLPRLCLEGAGSCWDCGRDCTAADLLLVLSVSSFPPLPSLSLGDIFSILLCLLEGSAVRLRGNWTGRTACVDTAVKHTKWKVGYNYSITDAYSVHSFLHTFIVERLTRNKFDCLLQFAKSGRGSFPRIHWPLPSCIVAHAQSTFSAWRAKRTTSKYVCESVSIRSVLCLHVLTFIC